MEDIHECFAQEALPHQNGVSFFIAHDLLLIATALQWISKRVSPSRSDFSSFGKGVADE